MRNQSVIDHKRGSTIQMKYITQYLVALILLVFSTFVTWYEGSAIRNDPWDWKYTAFFSKMLNGEVASSSDISQLDNFIYAAKFSPLTLYPTLILLSLSYIIFLSGYLLLKNNTKNIAIFFLLNCMFYVFSGIAVSDSSTIGGKYFSVTLLTLGFIHLLLAALFILKMRRKACKMESFT